MQKLWVKLRVEEMAGNICEALGVGGVPPRSGYRGAGARRVAGRGLHSPTFWLNVSAFCGIGGAFRNCVGAI
jgi:hypothetical protein